MYITLGRYGDIMIVLPYLYHEYTQTGVKPTLMVSNKYADVLDGCSYVERVVFNGDFTDIHQAVKEARTMAKSVVVGQVAGPYNTLNKVLDGGKFSVQTESFEKEMWRVAGKLNLWPMNLPLIFDWRDTERENALWENLTKDWHHSAKKKKLIVVCTSGFSSPFPYKDLMMELLHARLSKQYHFLDVSEVRSERIYDLLEVLENAHCVIATDSAVLHLCQAVKVPVCALIADTPTLWHGTAWRPNHVSYIRYGNFPKDYPKMFEAIENIGKPGSIFQT